MTQWFESTVDFLESFLTFSQLRWFFWISLNFVDFFGIPLYCVEFLGIRQVSWFESAHDSSSISKTWIDSNHDSTGFPEIDAHDSKRFPHFSIQINSWLKWKHLILSRLMIRLYIGHTHVWIIECNQLVHGLGGGRFPPPSHLSFGSSERNKI